MCKDPDLQQVSMHCLLTSCSPWFVVRLPCLRQQDPGVIPRLCRGLFQAIEALGPGKAVTVIASYVEVIY